ncbi:hypothetical protein GCM10012320_01150 [Sinomonas cellulolyticus]|nr:hypothetical protein GCM10012320_01150 [Sinomonas sp. KCTC 49339]
MASDDGGAALAAVRPRGAEYLGVVNPGRAHELQDFLRAPVELALRKRGPRDAGHCDEGGEFADSLGKAAGDGGAERRDIGVGHAVGQL